jgi:hypothetical protein
MRKSVIIMTQPNAITHLLETGSIKGSIAVPTVKLGIQ